MAKNYTFAEAVKIINEGTDIEAIVDIGRRFPVLLHKVGKVTALAGNAFVDLMSFMPDYLTANKVNTALKAAVGESTTTSEDADEADTEETTEATEDAEEATSTETDYESMSAKALWDMLGKAGKRKLAKSTKKADLVEACKQAFGAGAEVEETEEDEVEDATEANPYEGKSAMDLFKECKKRGIKAAPKKPAKFYADLLVKADAEATEEEADDDWSDDAEETKAETKSTKATAKSDKKAGKATKKAEADEDDDWDI